MRLGPIGKKILLFAASVTFVILASSGVAFASYASPHGGYSSGSNGLPGTDYCLQCHDVHDAAGDYVLMRESTVTETCATCHSLFGSPADSSWTDPPADLKDGGNATASQYSAYKITGPDKLSGHDLGISLNGAQSSQSDLIPGGSASLRVISSSEYEAGVMYGGEPASGFRSTRGLYCASCHTVHADTDGVDTDGDGVPNQPAPYLQGNFGRQLVYDDPDPVDPKHVYSWSLLSNRPNHNAEPVELDAVYALSGGGSAPVGAYNSFCIACHDQRDDQNLADPEGNLIHNHPPLCVSCHYRDGTDFPHTSNQNALLKTSSDDTCTECHGQPIAAGPLP